MENKLWYKKSADTWKEGLPIGNGRLAAMVLGYEETERIALNHEWLWTGKNKLREPQKAAHELDKVREVLLSGDYDEGTRLAGIAFGGNGGNSGVESRVDNYQPAGDFHFKLDHGEISNYRRELDLDKAMVTVTYQTDGTKITREVIAHLTYNLIIVRITSDNKKISGSFWLDRIDDSNCVINHSSKNNTLYMDGSFKYINGTSFRVESHIFTKDGKMNITDDGKMYVSDTNEILVYINIGTDAKEETPEEECNKYILPKKCSWKDILSKHIAEHESNYSGLKLNLSIEGNDIPTDERLKLFREGNKDARMVLLYFNFGRYLLCASSANGELPANLQGKWNEELNPPWCSDYHHDINLQMAYWVAEAGNMQKYTEALFAHIERFIPNAKKAAKDIYACDGVYFPIQTDAWGRATPEARDWAVWIGAAAWLSQHMWWHYEYSLDEEFLSKRAYPFFKEIAAFYESYLIEDEKGVLQIVPSQSPENRFEGGGDYPVTICVSSSMDIELIQDVLEHGIKSAQILNIDEDKIQLWKDILKKLPKLKIGSHGQLLEWNEEFVEKEPGHRHISHLYGLYPSDLFTKEYSKELYDASIVSLEKRLASGGGHTGWSRAWTACCFARIGNGDLAWEHMHALICDFATESLLDLHPPRIFQIDGNLGGAAAVIEMLFQSYHEEMEFLPALPKEWPEGSVTGLRARGNMKIDMEWKDNKLISASITPMQDRVCKIKDIENKYIIKNKDVLRSKGLIEFKVRANEKIIIQRGL